MPFLAKAKLKVAHELNSNALKADAMESSCCAWFAFATLAGLVLNATLHWWWADSVAGLVLVPPIVREGLEAVRNKDCSCHNTCGDA
jgi:divalent metal cation (Fe/Co/Zn/Cd) transporter